MCDWLGKDCSIVYQFCHQKDDDKRYNLKVSFFHLTGDALLYKVKRALKMVIIFSGSMKTNKSFCKDSELLAMWCFQITPWSNCFPHLSKWYIKHLLKSLAECERLCLCLFNTVLQYSLHHLNTEYLTFSVFNILI